MTQSEVIFIQMSCQKKNSENQGKIYANGKYANDVDGSMASN